MRLLLLLPALTVLGFTGCVKRSQSQVSHDVGQPVVESYGKQWHTAPDSQYVDLLNEGMAFGQIDPGKVLPTSHPMVARIQHWLDAIDSMLRREHGAEVKDVPKPVAKVLTSSEPNAFVMDNKICLKFSLEFTGAKDDTIAEKITFDRGLKKIDSVRGKCTNSTMSLEEQKEYLTWWVKALPGCSLSFAGDIATASEGCHKYLPASIAGAETIVVRQTSHFISFNTEIFRNVSESEMVSIIAHELAHYYRSHGTADGSLYNYFYQVDKHTTGTRPVADPSLAELGKKVLELSKKRISRASDSDDISDLAERAQVMSGMQEAVNKNLGQYTVEQEADEMALEWMSRLGLAVVPAVEAQIKLSEVYFNESPAIGWVTGTECRKAYEKRWTDESGKPMMVPVAAWNDIHHSPCFRAFNMDREIKAHQYASTGQEAKGPGESWETLKKSVVP